MEWMLSQVRYWGKRKCFTSSKVAWTNSSASSSPRIITDWASFPLGRAKRSLPGSVVVKRWWCRVDTLKSMGLTGYISSISEGDKTAVFGRSCSSRVNDAAKSEWTNSGCVCWAWQVTLAVEKPKRLRQILKQWAPPSVFPPTFGLTYGGCHLGNVLESVRWTCKDQVLFCAWNEAEQYGYEKVIVECKTSLFFKRSYAWANPFLVIVHGARSGKRWGSVSSSGHCSQEDRSGSLNVSQKCS